MVDEQQQHEHATAVIATPVPVDELFESPWNPRQYYPEGPMQELIESMRTNGYRDWLPLVVRPRPEGTGYEIGAGHRRSRAAKAAGISHVPCIVREMSDVEFLDVLNFDNTGREDVHPLHEAAGWQAWMEKTGKGVLDIAARIGQSKEYVYQRLKYSALVPDARKAFLDAEISAGHAVLIARLQAADQPKALKFAMAADWKGNRPGIRQLAEFIQRDVHLDMARAQFDVSDAGLVAAAGSCDACPKRTKNSPELLLAIEQVADPDLDDCTDPACFNSKVTAHLVQVKAKLAAEGKKPLNVSSNHGKPKKGCDFSMDQVQRVPPETKGAQTAVLADGPGVGEVIYVKPIPQSQNKSSSGANSEAAKREEEKRQKKLDLEIAVRRAILDEVRAKVKDVSRVDIEILLRDILHNADYDEELGRMHSAVFAKPLMGEALADALSELRDAEIFQLAVEVPLLEELRDWNVRRKPNPELLLAAAKRYKVDPVKIRKQVEDAASAAAPPVAAATEGKKTGTPIPGAKKKAKPVVAKTKIAAKPKKAAARKKGR